MINVFTDRHGLPAVSIKNDLAAALISLQGGHVMEYVPHGEEPILWMSSQSYFEQGKPIRGGIPICWPWFGAHPDNPDMPAHGFARLCLWSVAGGKELEDGSSEVLLRLDKCEVPEKFPAMAFALQLRVTVGRQLSVALEIANTSGMTFYFSGALHTYFNISDIANISVEGLDGSRYVSALEPEGVQQGAITFSREFDRVYLGTDATCYIVDTGFKRKIKIAKKGSLSTVVWNPWIEKSQRMPDFGDEEYHRMVCIETANAKEDQRHILPGESHILETIISKESL